MKLLTIAIPTRNRPIKIKNLINQLESIISGTNCEIIIVDNSDDFSTRDIIKENFDGDIKYFKNPDNQGLQYSIYELIKKSSSRYIWFLSDDEKLIEKNFNKLINILSSEDEIDIIVFEDLKKKITNENYLRNYFYDSTGVSLTLVKTEIFKNLIVSLKSINYLYPHTLLSLIAASDKNIEIRSTGFKLLHETNEEKNYLFPTHFILSFNLYYLTIQASKAGVSKKFLKEMRKYGRKKFQSKILEYIALNIETNYSFNLFKILRPYLELRTVQIISIAIIMQTIVNLITLLPKKLNKKILMKIVNFGNSKRYKEIIDSSTHMRFSSEKPVDTYTKRN